MPYTPCSDPCLYFRNSLRVATHTHTQSRTLERFDSITLRILLVIFAAVVIAALSLKNDVRIFVCFLSATTTVAITTTAKQQ